MMLLTNMEYFDIFMESMRLLFQITKELIRDFENDLFVISSAHPPGVIK